VIPLNNKSIAFLRKTLGEGMQPCPPYIIEYPDEIIVTNQSVILGWSPDLVDKECSGYHKLLANREHKLAGVKVHFVEGWREFLFHPKGKFVEPVEAEPTEDTGEGTIVYSYRKHLVEYHWTNFEVVEAMLARPKYMIYVQPKEQNIATQLHMMAVFDQERNTSHPVGVFSNQNPR